jgi:hypothetical protein
MRAYHMRAYRKPRLHHSRRGYYKCGREHARGRAGMCHCRGTIRYGARGRFSHRRANGWKHCNNRTFGDPIRGTVKDCFCNQDAHVNRILRHRYNHAMRVWRHKTRMEHVKRARFMAHQQRLRKAFYARQRAHQAAMRRRWAHIRRQRMIRL